MTAGSASHEQLVAGLLGLNRMGLIAYANQEAACMLGFQQSLIGRPIQDLLPGYSLPAEEQKPCYQIVTCGHRQLVVSNLNPVEYTIPTLVLIQDLEEMRALVRGTVTSNQVYRELDLLVESIHDDVLIADGNGVILRVSPSFEEMYGVTLNEVLGQTVYEMERQGIFNPSVTALVLQERRKVTILQSNKAGRKIVVTAVPVFDNSNEIVRVVSYSRDVTDFLALKEQYEKMETIMKRYSSEIEELRQKEMSFPGIVFQSPQMQSVLKLTQKVAGVDTNLIITGESGVGKNLIARLVHQLSNRGKGPFIEINCGAIPETLLESELFGYDRGAFTGAQREGKIGLIELAQDGTLFLDEIGELPLGLQVKLLKVIQEKVLMRVGGTFPVTVNFRLIAATNKELEMLVKRGMFREDLFYRLNVIPIYIPPLRERREDLLPLAMYFLDQANKKYKKRTTLSKQVVDLLLVYNWPGNVRELQNVIERLVITTDEECIGTHCLPENIVGTQPVNPPRGVTLRQAMELLERQLVKQAYEEHKTTVAVARALGISQPSAARKIKKHVSYSEKNKSIQ